MKISEFRKIINALPSDEPIDQSGVWYRTQKEHWLGWLKGYHSPGAYGRITDPKRDARYAYNHIVNYKMLLWIIEAAGVDPKLVRKANRAVDPLKSLQENSKAIRSIVPWEDLVEYLSSAVSNNQNGSPG
jgi:hypothetical protein